MEPSSLSPSGKARNLLCPSFSSFRSANTLLLSLAKRGSFLILSSLSFALLLLLWLSSPLLFPEEVAYAQTSSQNPLTLSIEPSFLLTTVKAGVPFSVYAQDSSGQPLPLPPLKITVLPGTGRGIVTPEGLFWGITPGQCTLVVESGDAKAEAPVLILPDTSYLTLRIPDMVGNPREETQIPLFISSVKGLKKVDLIIRVEPQEEGPLPLIGTINAPPGSIAQKVTLSPGRFQLHLTFPEGWSGAGILATFSLSPSPDQQRDIHYNFQIETVQATLSEGESPPILPLGGLVKIPVGSRGPVTQVLLTPSSVKTFAGATILFQATALDAQGNEVVEAPVSWRILSGPGEISERGIYWATNLGEAIIEAAVGETKATARVLIVPLEQVIPSHSVVLPVVTSEPGQQVRFPVLLGPGTPPLAGMELLLEIQGPSGASLPQPLEIESGPLAQGGFLGLTQRSLNRWAIGSLIPGGVQGPGLLLWIVFSVPSSAPSGAEYLLQGIQLDLSDWQGNFLLGKVSHGAIRLLPDTTPPQVNLSPLPSQPTRGVVEITASVTDNQRVDQVSLWVDQQRITTLNSPPYRFVLDTRLLSDGEHFLQVLAQDKAGNQTGTPLQKIIVDNTPPQIHFLFPTSGTKVRGSLDLRVSIADRYPRDYQLKVQGETLAQGGIPGSSEIQIPLNTANFPDGVLNLQLTATDLAGNLSQAELLLQVDNTPPTLKVGVQSAGPLQVTTPLRGEVALLIEAQDPSGIAQVTLSLPGQPPQILPGPPYRWQWNSLSFPDGTYLLTITSQDLLGNQAQQTFSLTIDNTRPELQILQPSPNAWVKGKVPLLLKIREQNPSTIAILIGRGISPSTWTQLLTAPLPKDGEWSAGVWDTLPFPDGILTLRALVQDTAGNEGMAQVTVKVDNTPPVVRWLSPPARGSPPPLLKGKIQLIGEAGDFGEIALVRFLLEEEELPPPTQQGPSYILTVDSSLWRDGPHRLTLKAKDQAGNESQEDLILETDNTPPRALLDLPPEFLGTTLSIQGTADDPANPRGHFMDYLLEYGIGPQPNQWTTILFSSQPVTQGILGLWRTGGLLPGIYTFRLTVRDQAGNQTTVLRSLRLIIPGDLNGDGRVNLTDALLALRIALGLLQPTSDQLQAGDLSPLTGGDRRITLSDVTLILRRAVGLNQE